MTVNAGIVLIHGYSGSREDLAPLALRLSADRAPAWVNALSLPGHGPAEATPLFSDRIFTQAIGDAAAAVQKEKKRLIVLGHSTGGVLVLKALAERSIAPDLLILASAPKKIDASYLDRWSRHRGERRELPFSSVAAMVSFINETGRRLFPGKCPVLVLHGEADELVPVQRASDWEEGCFAGPVRTVIVPRAEHHIFSGQNGALAVDVVSRAIADATAGLSEQDETALGALYAVEPEVKNFLARSPLSGRHIAQCPGSVLVAEQRPVLSERAASEPVFANIEITTRCNLKCTACARTIHGSTAEDMPFETFRMVLGLLPHAYRITLVGLGETLLHPRVVDLVDEAASQGRRVALVTNAMLLEKRLAQELLHAGLESIAFSLDGATHEVASAARPGTDLEKVLANIKAFVGLSRSTRAISTAVFSAVSMKTVAGLEQLIDVVSALGVHVMMLSDLNFRENLAETLWKNASEELAAQVKQGVAHAFKKNLPVLSVHGLEEFGLWDRYAKFLLMPPDRLYERSLRHTWCYSPWQTIPINVRGDVTLCDCQPGASAGNLLSQPFDEIWNGEAFMEHRRRMPGAQPPEACGICPRF